jgi:hypothetical protein
VQHSRDHEIFGAASPRLARELCGFALSLAANLLVGVAPGASTIGNG